MKSSPLALVLLAALGSSTALVGCGNSSDAPAAAPAPSPEDRATLAVKDYIQQNLVALHAATVELQAAAPAPDADGWSAATDPEAVGKMKAAWYKARTAYEHIEGAIAVLFPEYDASTDERYDGFLATAPDDNLFDDQGVTGIHAIERILWSDAIPGPALTFEQGVAGYRPAAFPTGEQEARDFKEKLAARLARETGEMADQFAPLVLDLGTAFHGVLASMSEQIEKISLASKGREESRYAQYTLADMKANVEGGQQIYQAFQPWLAAQGAEGTRLDGAITAGFGRLASGYAAQPGTALPPLPAMFNPTAPTPEDLATPFGQIFALVQKESDITVEGSLAFEMSQASDLLGLQPSAAR
jgi:iron uptake system component EfeO